MSVISTRPFGFDSGIVILDKYCDLVEPFLRSLFRPCYVGFGSIDYALIIL